MNIYQIKNLLACGVINEFTMRNNTTSRYTLNTSLYATYNRINPEDGTTMYTINEDRMGGTQDAWLPVIKN